MRFSKQHTKYDCGLVCIINACKWAGHSMSYSKHKRFLFNHFNIKENNGILEKELTKFIRSNKFPFKLLSIKNNISISDLKLVNNDQAMILGVRTKNYTHLCLIVEFYKNKLTLINWKMNTKLIIPYNKFNKYLNKNSIGYIIRK